MPIFCNHTPSVIIVSLSRGNKDYFPAWWTNPFPGVAGADAFCPEWSGPLPVSGNGGQLGQLGPVWC